MRFEHARRRRRGPGLTPLIDVVFLLLVFFMLASRFDREGALPLAVGAAAGAWESEAEVLRIHVPERGAPRIAGRAAPPARLRSEALRAAAEGRPVRVRPDPGAPLQSIVRVLGELARAGVEDAALERLGD